MCVAPWIREDRYPIKCGRCVECRLSYSREWAIRMTHEQMMHKRSCMVTLTYDDDHLPLYGQLVRKDLTDFLKRLRKNTGGFKYVACGEYGDKGRRPHFHIALFGLDFAPDRVYVGVAKGGDRRYTSKELGRSWRLGKHDIGALNFESAAYIARYIMKKVKGDGLCSMPLFWHLDGELVMPNSEFLAASKGIGAGWYDRFFMSDVFPHASVVTQQGSRAPVPRYYKERLKKADPDGKLAFDMSARTMLRMDPKLHDNLPARREARSTVASARTKLSVRSV